MYTVCGFWYFCGGGQTTMTAFFLVKCATEAAVLYTTGKQMKRLFRGFLCFRSFSRLLFLLHTNLCSGGKSNDDDTNPSHEQMKEMQYCEKTLSVHFVQRVLCLFSLFHITMRNSMGRNQGGCFFYASKCSANHHL